MGKNTQPQVENEQKVQTKYDRKMEKRRKQEEKEKKQAKIMRISVIVICAAVVVAIVGAIAVSIANKNTIVKDVYATIGDNEITKLEYDYYYSQTLNSYSYLMSYSGASSTSDLESMQYSENMTWKDFFDELTVEQIRQIKILVDDAAANGYTYDVAEDYEKSLDTLKTEAETAGVTLADFYKSSYGEYATQSNLEPFIKETLLANAYHAYLKEQNKPEAQEIKDYYEENKQAYDKVDYRSFAIAADVATDASEEDIEKAMADAKSKADAMMEARLGGADFRELCAENATETNKATYENTETDASLNEGIYYYAVPAAISDWLYEDGRAEGDITVMEDAEYNQYYVVEFINKYYDEADDATISDTISTSRVYDYLQEKKENYPVTDVKGELKYLTIEETAEETVDEGVTEETTDVSTEETTETAAEKTATEVAEDTTEAADGETAAE